MGARIRSVSPKQNASGPIFLRAAITALWRHEVPALAFAWAKAVFGRKGGSKALNGEEDKPCRSMVLGSQFPTPASTRSMTLSACSPSLRSGAKRSEEHTSELQSPYEITYAA